ncbi:hypothetical protein [Flammeovirga kamogawensis]|uniref:SMI1/KNR4 family protein n=1 Tax=Flammeovirga kamogawensis TaxID=373891 RepID=A0ABX8GTJ3_9BACT|nr:hypothetical protein [Flammeovirga kamogawensis]MBB6460038.1 hypothetical protein [Flammeovirga kamogawensis]QWG06915.1 hypothetical protein KM029_16640 [Flammeovirga kamogawensis]TRX68737.1 hypothetical protein EO216_11635 [Flammeovirga kamogawensis]
MSDQLYVYKFLDENNIGKAKLNDKTQKFEVHFYEEDFKKLADMGILSFCIEGGFVLGNDHENGGVKMIKLFNEPILHGVFSGEMEGYEFISPPITSDMMINEYEKINNNLTNNLSGEDLLIPTNCNVIDFRGKEICFIVLGVQDYYIVNRISTLNNLDKLSDLSQDFLDQKEKKEV